MPIAPTPYTLVYSEIVDVNVADQAVNLADRDDYGHRVQIELGKSICNLMFKWERTAGADRPIGKLTSSAVTEAVFKTSLIEAFNTSFVDIDGVTDGLHFGTAILDLNIDSRIRKDDAVSANDIPMAFVLYKLYGKTNWNTTGFIYNLEDGYDMLTSETIATALVNSFRAEEGEGNAIDTMFRDLLREDPMRFFTIDGTQEPGLFETANDAGGNGTWKLTEGDILEVRVKLIFDHPVTRRGVEGREHMLSPSDGAEDQQIIVNSGEYFFIRLQIKVVTGVPTADPANLVVDGTTLAGYNGVITGKIVIPAGITTISAGAFLNQTGLTQVVVPTTVTTIESGAFMGTSIESVTLQNVETIAPDAFRNVTTLTTITMPNVTTIDANAFNGCTSLVEVVLPEGLVSIGESAFEGCTSLGVDPASTRSTTTATGEFTIPESVTSIGYAAFKDCTNLTTLTIPSSVIAIENNTFRGCINLASLTLHNDIILLGANAFRDCSSLTSLNVPTSTTEIGSGCFYGCSGLTSLTIPSEITDLSDFTFYNCSGLTTLNLPTTIGSLGASVFEGCSGISTLTITNEVGSIGPSCFKGCSALTTLTIPNTLTSLPEAIFSGCSNLNTITLPSSITIINQAAFLGCSSLSAITLPTNLSSLGAYSFQGCTSLTSIAIPSSILQLNTYTFYGCTSLTSVTNTSQITALSSGVFAYTAVPSFNFPLITDIPSLCFAFNSALTEVRGNSVETINGTAFNSCPSLTLWPIPQSLLTISTGILNGYSGSLSVNGIVYTNPTGILSIPSSVMSIGASVFVAKTGIKEVIVPSSVMTIGNTAFQNCTGLTTAVFNGNPTTLGTNIFQGCTFLSNVSLGSSFTTIGQYMFNTCTRLTSITLPTSLTSIQFGAFTSSGLTSITIPGSVVFTGNFHFQACTSLTNVIIQSGVTTIPIFCFSGCSALTTISLPSTLTTILSSAFRNCSSLASITLPSSLTTIADYVFSYCTSLSAIVLPSSLTTLQQYAFIGCTSLQSMIIPSGVTAINAGLFQNCSSLTSCTALGNITLVNGYAFYKCTSLTNFTLPSTVTAIGTAAFYKTALQTITLPVGMIQIFPLAFAGSAITSITFPSTITTLNAPACCMGCTSLTSVTFTPSSSVLSVPLGFFYNCTSLSSITLASSVTILLPYAFANTGFTTINLPSITNYYYGVFAGCQNLTSVTLGGNSGFPHSTSFVNCPLLTSPPTAKRVLSAPLVNGNASIVPLGDALNDTGALNMTLNSGGTQDTGFYTLPGAATSGPNAFDFNFYNTNYGAGAASGITFSTNLAIGFGNGTTAISPTPTLGRYIFTGMGNRYVNRCAYKNPVTIGSHKILTIYLFYENTSLATGGVVYTAPGQTEIRFIKNTSNGAQYIEFRFYKSYGIANDGGITNTGTWQLTNGTAYQHTFTLGTGVTFFDNDSIVLSSDFSGSSWTFNPYCYVNL